MKNNNNISNKKMVKMIKNKKSSVLVQELGLYSTLAIEENDYLQKNGNIPLASDAAIQDGRDWVNHHQL